MKGVYIASKAYHGKKWIYARAYGMPIISSWIDEYKPGQSASMEDLWIRCIEEVRDKCGALILYKEAQDEILKGAFVEVGVALAVGKPVYAVGLSKSDYSFLHHPLVKIMPTIGDAMKDYYENVYREYTLTDVAAPAPVHVSSVPDDETLIKVVDELCYRLKSVGMNPDVQPPPVHPRNEIEITASSGAS